MINPQNLRLRQALEQSISHWAERWEQTSPMRALSDAFADRVIFLVFGKVNAGKSSFCNFLAEQFPQESVKRFYLDNGEITWFTGEFKEGVTETTARIQGMELGPRLVVLDSPGLHSVTDKEEDVVQRAEEKLASEGDSKALLKAPVSISVHAFESSAGTAGEFADAGLGRLVEQLVPLLDESRQYKAQKATQQMLNFLDGVVRKQLAETILPEVASLQSEAQKAKENLEHRQRLLTGQVVSEVCVAIPMLVERHKANRDEKSLAKDLNRQIEQALNATLQQELAEFKKPLLLTPPSRFSLHFCATFCDVQKGCQTASLLGVSENLPIARCAALYQLSVIPQKGGSG